jgi:hypothetical protein
VLVLLLLLLLALLDLARVLRSSRPTIVLRQLQRQSRMRTRHPSTAVYSQQQRDAQQRVLEIAASYCPQMKNYARARVCV